MKDKRARLHVRAHWSFNMFFYSSFEEIKHDWCQIQILVIVPFLVVFIAISTVPTWKRHLVLYINMSKKKKKMQFGKRIITYTK